MSIILTICISGKGPARREPYVPGYVSGNIEATNVGSHLEQRAASIRFRARTETQSSAAARPIPDWSHRLAAGDMARLHLPGLSGGGGHRPTWLLVCLAHPRTKVGDRNPRPRRSEPCRGRICP